MEARERVCVKGGREEEKRREREGGSFFFPRWSLKAVEKALVRALCLLCAVLCCGLVCGWEGGRKRQAYTKIRGRVQRLPLSIYDY